MEERIATGRYRAGAEFNMPARAERKFFSCGTGP